MNSALQGILSALAYYDVFGVPLTAQEIYLAWPASDGPRPAFEDVERGLAEAVRAGTAEEGDGLYWLPGREAIFAERKRRYLLAEDKYRKVRSFMRLARFTPFLRAAFVCNTLARSYAGTESDTDIYLVAAPGRIWLTRLCITGLAALLRARPTENESADRLCLSFFVTENALDIRRLAIDDDVYLAHWLHELYPIYDESGIGRRSFAENSWMRDVLPESRLQAASPRRALAHAPRWKNWFERSLDALFGDRLEGWAERQQRAWLPTALKQAAAADGSGVVLEETTLKFHDRDRRAEIRDTYHRKLATLLSFRPSEASGGISPKGSLDFARDDKVLAL